MNILGARTDKRLMIAIVALLIICTGLVFAIVAVMNGVGSGRVLVAEFSGIEDGKTPFFTVKDDWKMEVKCRDGAFYISQRYDWSGKYLDRVPGWPRDKEKSCYYGKGGTFQFDIVYSNGPWRIRIYQYDNKIH